MSDGVATLFCGVESAARLERVETAAIAGAVTVGRDAGGFVVPFGGGAACFAGEGSPLNKVVGVGFAGVPSAAEWERVEAAYAEVGAPVQVELAHLADSRIGEGLTGRGYRLSSFENVLGLRLGGRTSARIEADREEGDGADNRPTHIEVQREEGAAFDTWLDVVVDGFASPDDDAPAHEEFPREAIAAVMRNMAAVGETRRYLAYRAGVPVGGASMRIDGGVAALAGAATLPAHRRQGVQTALLAARLTEAADAGCDLAVITTQPGSKSQQNAQARGFAVLYTRAILTRTAS